MREFVDSCVENIDNFFDAMLVYSDKIAGVLGGLCGLAALFYIGSKVWGNYSRGESIEIYPLLRPFVIGLICANFNVVVVGGIRGLADPVCDYFKDMEMKTSAANVKSELNAELKKVRQEADDLQKQLEEEGNEEDEGVGVGKAIRRAFNNMWQKAKNGLFIAFAWLIGWIAELLAALTKFVLAFTRCFSMSVMCILGPLVFAISIFPGYKQGISQWIARFVCIYMWIPLFHLVDIFINTVTLEIGKAMVGQISSLVAEAKATGGGVEYISFRLQGIQANLAIVGALISLLTAALYKSVPTLASWIIAGGDASGQLSSVAGFAVNTAMYTGMAATVIGGGILKGGAALARGGGAAAGKGLAKAGQKIAGKTAGGGGGGNGGLPVNGMGAGPMDAPVKTPVGFHTASAAASPDPTTANLRLRDGGFSDAPSATDAVTPELPVSKFRQVSGTTLEWVGKQLRRPKLNHIMKHGNALQRYHAAQDPYITKGVLKKAIDDPNIFVQQAALKNGNISPKLLQRAMKYGYAETATQAARLLQDRQGGKATPGIQQVFNANIPVGNVPGKTVAPFQETPHRSAEKPSVSKFRQVSGTTLEWVGKQLRRPKLNHIMKHGNALQRYHAAQDPYITKGVLKKAIADPDKSVQQAALKNSRISPSLLKRAAKYGYAETATLAIQLLQTKKGGKNA